MNADTPEPPPRRKWHLQRWLIVLVAGMLAYGAWTAYAFRSALKQAYALGWPVDYTDPVKMIRMNWKNAFKKETWLDGVVSVSIPKEDKLVQQAAIVHRLNPKELLLFNSATSPVIWALEGLARLEGVTIYDDGSLTNLDALKNLPALKEVQLVNCTALTNVDALKHLSALQGVGLDDCTALTNVDALKSLPALRRVSLSGCTGLTNVDGLKGLTALESVYLAGCTGLTNVDALKNLTAIKAIWLNGCTGLTTEHITALKAALPKTDIFTLDPLGIPAIQER